MSSVSKEEFLKLMRGIPGAAAVIQHLTKEERDWCITEGVCGSALWMIYSYVSQNSVSDMHKVFESLISTGKCVIYIENIKKECDVLEYVKDYIVKK